MRTSPALLVISLLTSACGSNSCNPYSGYSGCAYHYGDGDTPSSPTTKTLEGDDAVDLITTADGVFAVASIHSTGELRTYRLEATGDEEAPLFVTLASKVALDEKNAPEPRAKVTLEDASAWVEGGDAYLDSVRIGAPGITRAVALADVPSEDAPLRVVAIQTESPRMLVFFAASDTTNPIAFEPLE